MPFYSSFGGANSFGRGVLRKLKIPAPELLNSSYGMPDNLVLGEPSLIAISPDGFNLYVGATYAGRLDGKLLHIKLSNAFDLSQPTLISERTMPRLGNSKSFLAVSNDSACLIIFGLGIYVYTLDVDGNITTNNPSETFLRDFSGNAAEPVIPPSFWGGGNNYFVYAGVTNSSDAVVTGTINSSGSVQGQVSILANRNSGSLSLDSINQILVKNSNTLHIVSYYGFLEVSGNFSRANDVAQEMQYVYEDSDFSDFTASSSGIYNQLYATSDGRYITGSILRAESNHEIIRLDTAYRPATVSYEPPPNVLDMEPGDAYNYFDITKDGKWIYTSSITYDSFSNWIFRVKRRELSIPYEIGTAGPIQTVFTQNNSNRDSYTNLNVVEIDGNHRFYIEIDDFVAMYSVYGPSSTIYEGGITLTHGYGGVAFTNDGLTAFVGQRYRMNTVQLSLPYDLRTETSSIQGNYQNDLEYMDNITIYADSHLIMNALEDSDHSLRYTFTVPVPEGAINPAQWESKYWVPNCNGRLVLNEDGTKGIFQNFEGNIVETSF
jgi:hypothetical protein